MERRSLLAFAAPMIAAGLTRASGAQTATNGADDSAGRNVFRQFLDLPGKKSYLIEVSPPGVPWRTEYLRDARMFVGSAVKTFILATIARVVPANIKAYAKGGSIDWQDFHAICVPGQMVVGNTPVTFCFTLNWTGSDSEVPAVSTAYQAAVAAILAKVAKMVG